MYYGLNHIFFIVKHKKSSIKTIQGTVTVRNSLDNLNLVVNTFNFLLLEVLFKIFLILSKWLIAIYRRLNFFALVFLFSGKNLSLLGWIGLCLFL